jgi:hypothetical protein
MTLVLYRISQRLRIVTVNAVPMGSRLHIHFFSLAVASIVSFLILRRQMISNFYFILKKFQQMPVVLKIN